MQLGVNGKTVFAATGGKEFDPAKPAMLFLHGAGMDHTVWMLLARWFAHRGFGVLAVPQRCSTARARQRRRWSVTRWAR